MSWSKPTPPPNDPSKPTREEQADAELAALLAALDEEHSAAAASKKTDKANPLDFSNEPSQQSFGSDYPDMMNCRTCFDEMYYCYSLGGQFLNVYRYGTMRDCSQKSADWRFCMRTKVHGPVARKAMIQARNREKAAKFQKMPNSEDVWAVRTEPLKDPFSGQVGDLRRDDIS